MHNLVLVALCATIALVGAQGGDVANGGFTAGGSFEANEQFRFSSHLRFVARASCACASAGNPSGDYDGCSGSGISGEDMTTMSPTGVTMPGSGMTMADMPTTPEMPSGSLPTDAPSGSLPTVKPSGEWPSGLPSGLPSVCYGPSGLPSGTVSPPSGVTLPSGVTPPSVTVAPGSGSASASGECATSGEYAAHNGGWFEGDLCLFLQILFQWSEELSESDSITLRAWIQWAQINIIQSSKYTSDEIRFSVLISECFSFLEENVSIMEVFQWKYLEIDGFSWGFLQWCQSAQLDALVSGSFSVSITQVITVSGGQNMLTQAATSWAGSDAGKLAAAQWFNSQVISICSAGGSTQEILVQLKAVFEQFSIQYSSYSSSFFSFQISGFSLIGGFSDYCSRAWRVQNFGLAIGGSVDSCALLTAIQSIYNTQSYSISFRSQVKQWYTAISTYFSSTTDISSRINFFANETYQFFLENNWNESIIFNENITVTYSNGTTVFYGTFYELIDAFFGFSSGQLTCPGESQTTTTMAAATTTTTAAATTTTTAAATTTTTTAATTTSSVGTGQCSSVYQCNAVSSNTTWLLTSISNANMTTMTRSQWNQFKGYYTHLSQVAGSGGNQSYVLTQSQTTLNNFATASSSMYQYIHNITIVNWGGTIDQYCKCPTPSS